MPATPLVELREISVKLDDKILLDRISWQLMPHRHWGILGPNGAGKTTLIKILGGLMWPNAGGVVLRGGARLANLQQLRRGIGWVHCQLARRIPAGERVDQLIQSGRYAELGLRPPIRTQPEPSCREDAARWMRQLDLTHLAQRYFVTLSQGEQQIALLARAMMARPSMIILDEPCAGLDPSARERFLAALSAAIEQTAAPPSIVMVTHHMEELIPAIDQLMMLKAGAILASGPPAELITRPVIGQLYDRLPRHITRDAGRYWPRW